MAGQYSLLRKKDGDEAASNTTALSFRENGKGHKRTTPGDRFAIRGHGNDGELFFGKRQADPDEAQETAEQAGGYIFLSIEIF